MLTIRNGRKAGVTAVLGGTLLGGTLAGGVLATATPAGAATGGGTVYVVQGITGDSLDVEVDGRTVQSGVAAKTVVGPLSLSAGTHSVTLRRGQSVVAGSTVKVAAGSSTDLVAHRRSDSTRSRSLTAFVNDRSAVPAGKARLVVAHMAAVPPADILVDDAPLVRNIANGESSTSVVPAGSYKVAIVPTLTKGPAVLGPTTLPIKAGTLTNVFAIGDPDAGTMDAVVQELPLPTGDGRAPGRVETGDGGQAAALVASASTSGTSGSTGTTGLTGGVAAVGALAAGSLLVARRRAAGRR